jgi:hypothetical protein
LAVERGTRQQWLHSLGLDEPLDGTVDHGVEALFRLDFSCENSFFQHSRQPDVSVGVKFAVPESNWDWGGCYLIAIWRAICAGARQIVAISKPVFSLILAK